jgi:NAD-dependent DNA ligase
MSKTLYLSKAKIAQTFGTLQGLIDGITADGKILPAEVAALARWLKEHDHISHRPPFSEIILTVKGALADGILTDEEIQDIRFVCDRVMASLNYEFRTTSQIQKLHGIASGIASDGEINNEEWNFLKKWIEDNTELRGSWPYDEIEALTIKHHRSADLTDEERSVVIHYLNDFCGFNKNAALTHPLNEPNIPITGICAVCPEITFKGKVFCLTGHSKKESRSKIAKKILAAGGFFKDAVTKDVDYLVVCAEGSPMWTYSCYGRKVERAVQLRKAGHHITIVHEYDFWDSLEDAA